ncbi:MULTISPECIES: pyridoxamine 5'-phosphate oxidase [Moraxella]|uniref:Pyridoxine/pyridoxamine 5'-phosphate oxidase n=1 Tax=Moraxella lacunata TaxID=477 RepID=A0A1B8PW26_MORLA|nr:MULTISPECIES: pyridoxamine 5'-phosphate oxidase [Moraxella]MBE9578052.1 pyridoxamine 5'-phosphate oxidase [Moraxella sp. K1664]MBE9587612.1 pyridoxamine 5'-phosphate oxidase [Moraxella sp. K1630]MBE9595810.1 pyridoxamine 5'-phosphate oxidase [Moraxella sp. K2450]MDH9217985.1 pyridoxamine 5'-phosphate oxidase [Moraxella lacunata]MDI4482554.1 pyridoxamine 5'-phosphate oxidase [Moraxella lacunata]
MAIDFSASRLSYEKDELIEKNIGDTPYPLLQKWINDAISEQIGEAYAFSLATCGADRRPSVRTLLMREIVPNDDDIQMIFYTNYDSDKGQDLADNPFAEALFFWHTLERQVRASGRVVKLSDDKSETYYHSRPKDSQLAAWVSRPQSGVVESREIMESDFAKLSEQFGEHIPKPEFWGGYCLLVDKIEFWQGRANRMHDRIVYHKGDKGWERERILP